MKSKLFILSTLAILLCLEASASTNSPDGYFLSWSQKMDLIGNGRMSDYNGTRYDVWICPGYVPPARYAKEHLKRAGSDFGEYVKAKKYRDLKEGSRSCFRWAFKDCGWKFMLKGIPRTWSENFGEANKRTERRVFGWWLAYPWAFMESTVESAVRLAAGTAGTAGGAAAGLVVVPAFHAVNSGVAGTCELAVNTLALPTIGMAWNTVVSPPLALVGQKPSPSRVDGFWVSIVDGPNVNHAAYTYEEPSTLAVQDISVVSDYGLLLLNETRPYRQRRGDIEKESSFKKDQLRAELQKVDDEARSVKSTIAHEEKERVLSLTTTNQLFKTVQHFSENERAIRANLAERDLPREDIDETLRLLRVYGAQSFRPQSNRPKTDPVRRTVEISTEVLENAP